MSTVMMTLAAVAAMQSVGVYCRSDHDCGRYREDFMCLLNT